MVSNTENPFVDKVRTDADEGTLPAGRVNENAVPVNAGVQRTGTALGSTYALVETGRRWNRGVLTPSNFGETLWNNDE